MKAQVNFLTGLCCLVSMMVFPQNGKNEILGNREASHQYTSEYEAIAQAQLDAYNAKDVDAFLKPYSDDVEVFRFPGKLLYTGKDEMRKRYQRMFETTPNLHCDLVNRIIEQNVVIDKEKIRLGDKILEASAIYVIKNFKIQEVYFIQ